MNVRTLSWSMTLLAAALPCQARNAAEPKDLFRAIDAFDRFDPSTFPLVRVQTLTRGHVSTRLAFLLGSDGRRHDVRWLDLGRATVEPDARTAVGPIDIADAITFLSERIAAVRDPDSGTGFYASPETPMHPAAEAVLLARVCDRLGRRADAERLLALAPDGEGHLAEGMARQLMLDFADPALSWQDLLRRHDVWLEHFRDNRMQPNVRAAREQIADTIATLADPELPAAKRVLLDDPWLDGNQLIDAGHVDPPVPPPADGTRPLDQLLARDLDVVLDLIALLDDEAPTRAVRYSSRYGGVFSRIRVGDQAEAALRRLAGGWAKPVGERPNPVGDWIEWYGEAKRVGVRAMFERRIDALESRAIRPYLDRWPDGADRVLRAMATHDYRGRATGAATALLEHPALSQRRDVRDACRRCLAAERTNWRAVLADRLLDAGARAALDVIAADWLAHDFAELPFEQPAHDDPCLRQLHVLVRHGGAETWQQIADRMQHESVRHRLAKVLVHEPWQLPADAGERTAVATPARRAFAALLADDFWFGTQMGVRHRGGFATIAGPTRADVAAFVLARIWPDEFRYDPVTDAEARHAQLGALRSLLASDQER